MSIFILVVIIEGLSCEEWGFNAQIGCYIKYVLHLFLDRLNFLHIEIYLTFSVAGFRIWKNTK